MMLRVGPAPSVPKGNPKLGVATIGILAPVAIVGTMTDHVTDDSGARAFLGGILVLVILMVWLNDVEPALHWRLGVLGPEVIPTRRRLVDALRDRPPRSMAISGLRLWSIRWIPQNRVPSHCFVLVLQSDDGRRFRADSRKDAAAVFDLLRTMERLGLLENQPLLLQAFKFWNPENHRWEFSQLAKMPDDFEPVSPSARI
jgi:hypothetical protein